MHEAVLEAALRQVFQGLVPEAEHLLNREGTEVLREGSFGSALNDVELKADDQLGTAIVRQIIAQPDLRALVHTITIEGRANPVVVNTNGTLKAYVDPLDNSQGFYASMQMLSAHRGSSAHRFASVITLVDSTHGRLCNFDDVVAVGVQPLHRAHLLPIVAVKGVPWREQRRSTAFTTFFPPREEGGVALNQTILFEAYYPETRRVIEQGFSDISGALRSWGCAALEISAVATGEVEAFVSCSQKHHEAGAFLAVLASGGVAYSWRMPAQGMAQGKRYFRPVSLLRTPYHFWTRSPLLVASSDALAWALLERLARGYGLPLLTMVGP